MRGRPTRPTWPWLRPRNGSSLRIHSSLKTVSIKPEYGSYSEKRPPIFWSIDRSECGSANVGRQKRLDPVVKIDPVLVTVETVTLQGAVERLIGDSPLPE